MKYNSIYDYLDEFFSLNLHPSEKQIQNARKEYWRLYFREYHRKRREEKKEVTLCFDRNTYKEILDKKGSLRTTEFLYGVIKDHLQNRPMGEMTNETITTIQIRLMTVVNDLDDLSQLLQEDDNQKLEKTLSEIEDIERELSLIT